MSFSYIYTEPYVLIIVITIVFINAVFAQTDELLRIAQQHSNYVVQMNDEDIPFLLPILEPYNIHTLNILSVPPSALTGSSFEQYFRYVDTTSLPSHLQSSIPLNPEQVTQIQASERERAKSLSKIQGSSNLHNTTIRPSTLQNASPLSFLSTALQRQQYAKYRTHLKWQKVTRLLQGTTGSHMHNDHSSSTLSDVPILETFIDQNRDVPSSEAIFSAFASQATFGGAAATGDGLISRQQPPPTRQSNAKQRHLSSTLLDDKYAINGPIQLSYRFGSSSQRWPSYRSDDQLQNEFNQRFSTALMVDGVSINDLTDDIDQIDRVMRIGSDTGVFGSGFDQNDTQNPRQNPMNIVTPRTNPSHRSAYLMKLIHSFERLERLRQHDNQQQYQHSQHQQHPLRRQQQQHPSQQPQQQTALQVGLNGNEIRLQFSPNILVVDLKRNLQRKQQHDSSSSIGSSTTQNGHNGDADDHTNQGEMSTDDFILMINGKLTPEQQESITAPIYHQLQGKLDSRTIHDMQEQAIKQISSYLAQEAINVRIKRQQMVDMKKNPTSRVLDNQNRHVEKNTMKSSSSDTLSSLQAPRVDTSPESSIKTLPKLDTTDQSLPANPASLSKMSSQDHSSAPIPQAKLSSSDINNQDWDIKTIELDSNGELLSSQLADLDPEKIQKIKDWLHSQFQGMMNIDESEHLQQIENLLKQLITEDDEEHTTTTTI